MKQGKTLMELATELERQKETKRDFLANGKAITVTSGWEDAAKGEAQQHLVMHVGNDIFDIGQTAHDQIAGRLGIPTKYYERMRNESPELLTTNINHWLGKSEDRFMVRTLDQKARAMLSDRFRPLDNADMAEVGLPALLEAGMEIESCEVTDSRLYIKATTERIKGEVALGQVVQSGIIISNSEIGLGSILIEPLVYTLACKNGMIVNSAGMRKAHIGRGNAEFEGAVEFFRNETRLADDRAFWMKVRDTIAATCNEDGFKKILEKLKASRAEKITRDPVETIEIASKRFGLGEKEGHSVLLHLLQGGDLSKYGLVNAITAAAQEVESYDRSTDMERLGGTVLELPKTDWKEIAQVQ